MAASKENYGSFPSVFLGFPVTACGKNILYLRKVSVLVIAAYPPRWGRRQLESPIKKLLYPSKNFAVLEGEGL